MEVLILNCFCAAEKNPEKKPPGAFGWVKVPPGVFVSSTVGVKGALIEVDSLLGRLADCARRCLILSTELGGLGDPFSGEVGLENVAELELKSVGVGGVTKVVGASRRFGGVAGRDVSIGCLTRGFFGVSGLSCACSCTNCCTSLGFAVASSCSDGCGALPGRELRLFLLLVGRNNPPNPPPPPPLPTDLTDSRPPDFLRDNAEKDPRSLLPGEGLRAGTAGGGRASTLEGSTMWGMLTDGSAEDAASDEFTASESASMGLACWLSWGEDSVRYPAWESRGDSDGLIGFLLEALCQSRDFRNGTNNSNRVPKWKWECWAGQKRFRYGEASSDSGRPSRRQELRQVLLTGCLLRD